MEGLCARMVGACACASLLLMHLTGQEGWILQKGAQPGRTLSLAGQPDRAERGLAARPPSTT